MRSKVNYRYSKQTVDCYGKDIPEFDEHGSANLNVIPYQPIQDKKTIEHFKELKTKILLAVHNATVLLKLQEVKFDNATYTIMPFTNEEIIKKFKANEW